MINDLNQEMVNCERTQKQIENKKKQNVLDYANEEINIQSEIDFEEITDLPTTKNIKLASKLEPFEINKDKPLAD